MAQTTYTFRIFVSSTFSDLHAERNALREFVFPRLRELCLQNGCRFQAIDLRWGVSAEAGRDQKTMQICLEEIKRCQRVTPRPNFIVFLGDRYGWCPLPEEILADEFEKILQFISDDKKKDLLWDEKTRNGWYRLDENTKPPFYCLQQREGKYAEYSVWEKVERKLHAILENATVDFDEKTRTKYVASATEQEINQGLKDEKAMEHVFCFFRSFSNQDKFSANFTEQAGKFFEFDKNKQPNEIANRKLANLKKRLRDTLPKQNVHNYSAQWLENSDSDMPHTTDHIGTLPDNLEDCLKLLDEDPKTANLCVDVWRQLAPAILEEIGKIKKVSDVKKEKDEHEKFGTDRAKHFVGRTDYLDKIREYVEADNRRQPLCLWGESGSGKSALMAYAAQQIKDDLVVRFIGATPPSSDIRALLESLCQEISEKYDADKTTIPADYNELVKEFPKRLELDKKGKRMVLFLDALDQISEAENAQNLSWLPENLPENVHLIVSTLPNDSLDILKRRLPAENIIELEPMPKDEGDKVLDLWLSDKKRTLQDRQRAEILNKFAANGLPLYLKFAFEEVRLWRSYDEIKPLSTDVEGIIGDLFTRLSDEANHGAMMVKYSLGYLAAARYGLTEDELLEVLSMNQQVMDDFKDRSKKTPEVDSLPVVVWSRLYFDLEPYLTERAGADAALLSFYHRQLGEVTAKKYVSGDDKKRAHKHLADYFELQDYWQETPAQYRNRVGEFPNSARRANGRKASEFAFQLRQFGDYESLEQIHTSLDFLESKTATGLFFELAKDFTEALKIIPSERPIKGVIELLDESINRHSDFIYRYPNTLFQCLWNSCWWFDCPQLAAHYPIIPNSQLENTPWNRRGWKIHKLLEKWKHHKSNEGYNSYWLRSLRPPHTFLGSPLRICLQNAQESIEKSSISNDRKTVAFVAGEEIFIWDNIARKITKVWKTVEQAAGIALSPKGRFAISWYHEGFIKLWNTVTGDLLLKLSTKKFGHINSLIYSNDGSKIAIGAKKAFILDTSDWNVKISYCAGKDGVTDVKFTETDDRLAVSGGDGTLIIYNLNNNEFNQIRQANRGEVKGWTDVWQISLSHDGELIAASCGDGTIQLWKISNSQLLKTFIFQYEDGTPITPILRVALSLSGRELAVAVNENIFIYEIETNRRILELIGHESDIFDIYFLSTTEIVSSGLDRSFRIWDISKQQSLINQHDTEFYFQECSFTPDGSSVVTFVLHSPGSRLATDQSPKKPGEEVLMVLKGTTQNIRFACSGTTGEALDLFLEDVPVSFHQKFIIVENNRLEFSKNWYIQSIKKNQLGLLLNRQTGKTQELNTYGSEPKDNNRQYGMVSDGSELFIINLNNKTQVAWYPESWLCGAIHPTNFIWAGTSGKYLTIVQLETFEEEHPNSPENIEWYWADQNQNTDYKTIFQPSGLPTLAEMQEIPRWAKVAFAARCGRYVQKVFSEVWCEVPNFRSNVLDKALFAVERGQFQNVMTLLSEVNSVVNSTNELRPSRNSDANQAYNAAAATLYAVYALKCAAQSADSSLSENTVDSAIASVQANPSLLTVLRSDFNRLRVSSQLYEWVDEDQTPLGMFLENGSI